MSNRIKCYTLFDITKTGIRQRSKVPEGVDEDKFIYQRNTQVNLDTILQVISLRSQPELVSDITKFLINLEEFGEFGFMYQQEDELCNCWEFVFEVQHHNVFDNDELFGNLYRDCDNIPMIKVGTEFNKVINLLDSSPEFKNIHFEIL
jgi:hypothetical protein